MLCPICKKYHFINKLDEIIFCDNKVTRKLAKYKSINRKKMIKEFFSYSKIECIDCSDKVEFNQTNPCAECGELLCSSCHFFALSNHYLNKILCKTCFTDISLEKCKFCKNETDMFRPCVKCYERICMSCIGRCKGCNQIICPHCDVFNKTCQTCFDERHFYLKLKK